MKQDELISKVAAEAGISKADAERALKAVGAVVHVELGTGGEVTMPGIGKLGVSIRAARTGRNPRTGDKMEIPAKKVPHFSAAKALKDAVA